MGEVESGRAKALAHLAFVGVGKGCNDLVSSIGESKKPFTGALRRSGGGGWVLEDPCFGL